MKVRLTRKLAECIDGVDLGASRVGDVLELPDLEARLLIAEEWAIDRERRQARRSVEVDRRHLRSAPLEDYD